MSCHLAGSPEASGDVSICAINPIAGEASNPAEAGKVAKTIPLSVTWTSLAPTLSNSFAMSFANASCLAVDGAVSLSGSDVVLYWVYVRKRFKRQGNFSNSAFVKFP